MTVSVASFRRNFSEFAASDQFAASQIQFYLNLGAQLLNQDRWGPPAAGMNSPANPVLGQAMAGALPQTTYYVQTTYINGEPGETTPSTEVSLLVPVNNVLTVASPQMIVGAKGYNVYAGAASGAETRQNAQPIPIGTPWQMPNTGLVVGASVPTQNTADIPNTESLYDLGLSLFVAHNIAIEARAQQESQGGKIPGMTTGPVSSKSVDKVSVSYDVGSGIEEGAGHWNLTVYGVRFIKMCKMMGAGPVQIGADYTPPPFGSGTAFAGPWVFNFPNPSG